MFTRQILNALSTGNLFLQDLPEAPCFDQSTLHVPDVHKPLNLEQKLGHLYEDGLSQLLEKSVQYELLERGLQLQRGRHETVGELDFLFRDTLSERLIHLELAVKFYLAIESPDGLLLPGPNSRDNFYNKLQRLRTHQLTLTTRFQDLLPARYQSERIHPEHLVIGCLFDHISAQAQATPEYIHSHVRRAHWLRQSEFPIHFPDCTSPLVIPKPLWPVENPLESQLEPFDLEAPISRCTMLKIPNQHKPIFITPDTYPVQPTS